MDRISKAGFIPAFYIREKINGKILSLSAPNGGDEGKAKITDLLAEKADLIIRYQGGCNAGHTVVAGEKHINFTMIPSGILYDKTICFIGAGTVIHPESFERELNELKAEGVDFKNLKNISSGLYYNALSYRN